MLPFKINHIAISVKQVDLSFEFYNKVFQFQEIKNTASNSKTRWLSIGDGKQLHLIPRPQAEIKTNKAVHFALSTADIASFILFLNKLKIPYTDWKENYFQMK
ncbi:MAG: VOC family protein [Flavicella sp.]|nr:VOC family protein [Flavicella sp.]